MYSTRQFLHLTGLTVKSLRHYQRLDLVRPARTSAGYRRYSRADVSRVYQLSALKSFGFSLRAIKSLLAGRRLDLSSHLHALERERARLTLAIDTLRRMPATIEEGDSRERLLGEVVWEWSEAQHQATRATTPTAPARVCESRLTAFQELAGALETDPTGERTRAMAIAFRNSGDPETRSAIRRRADWPAGMRRYLASLYDATPEVWERVINFIEALPPAAGAA